MNTSKLLVDTHSKSKRSNYILPNDLIASIYHFKLLDQSCPFDYSSLSFCIPKKTLRTYIHNLFTSYIHVLDKNEITLLSDKIKFYRNKTLIVLPTTSFYETNRCSLKSEIELYKKYIYQLSKDSLVLISLIQYLPRRSLINLIFWQIILMAWFWEIRLGICLLSC